MAEINVAFTWSASKNGSTAQNAFNFSDSMAGNELAGPQTQLIGTSAEALTWGEAANVTYYAIQNLDAANYVDLSMASDATNPFCRLKAGKSVQIPGVSGATVYAKANTAAVRVAKFYAET